MYCGHFPRYELCVIIKDNACVEISKENRRNLIAQDAFLLNTEFIKLINQINERSNFNVIKVALKKY